ncbi:MAG: RES family NAD+ phosphorylase [Sulfuricella sp.]
MRGSRFRSATDPGVFYGAESVRTASAKLGYWRWKFLQDAVDLEKLEPVAHTAFRADIGTLAVNLRKLPFSADAAAWLHPSGARGKPRRHCLSDRVTRILHGAWRC